MTQDPIVAKPLNVNVVGVTFDDRQTLIRKIGVTDAVMLCREPENEYDKNAIGVNVDKVGQIGYLSKNLAEILAPYLDAGKEYKSMVSGWFGKYTHIGVTVSISFDDETMIKIMHDINKRKQEMHDEQ